jgi:hypothetical protein
MPFLAYVAIILVSLGGILFEVNWLTSPKLDTKPAVQASTAAPAKLAEATPAKSEAPIVPRSETAPPRNVAPTVTMVPPAPSVSAVTPAPPALAVSTNNKCDVAACSAAYQSFRASDCTFQPMEGPRKVCDRAPDTTQRAAAPARDMRVETVARRPGKDVELRAVERTVRRITAEEAGIDADMGRSEVIMIDRRDW